MMPWADLSVRMCLYTIIPARMTDGVNPAIAIKHSTAGMVKADANLFERRAADKSEVINREIIATCKPEIASRWEIPQTRKSLFISVLSSSVLPVNRPIANPNCSGDRFIESVSDMYSRICKA